MTGNGEQVVTILQRNNVHVTGNEDGPTLLFVHGFGCDQRMWRFVAPAFEADHKVVLIDQVGAGASDLTAWDPVRHASLQGYADDAVEVCRELGLSDVTFVGHSVSSMTGGLAAISAPDVISGLVMIGASPRYINDPATDYVGGFGAADIDGLLETMDQNYLGWSSQLAPTIMGSDAGPELVDELEHSFCATDPAIAKHFARTTFLGDNRDDLAAMDVPTLVLQVEADALAPKDVGQFVVDRLPNGELVWIEGVGHCPHMSHPEQVVAAMRTFLARLTVNA